MAERKRSIQTRQWGGGGLQVYTDVTVNKIQDINGVVSVDDRFLVKAGYVIVHIDQRWDEKDVIDEIEVMQRGVDDEYGTD